MATITPKIKRMVQEVETFQMDAEKADKGQKVACTRLRKKLMSLIKTCKSIRVDLMNIKKQ